MKAVVIDSGHSLSVFSVSMCSIGAQGSTYLLMTPHCYERCFESQTRRAFFVTVQKRTNGETRESGLFFQPRNTGLSALPSTWKGGGFGVRPPVTSEPQAISGRWRPFQHLSPQSGIYAPYRAERSRILDPDRCPLHEGSVPQRAEARTGFSPLWDHRIPF